MLRLAAARTGWRRIARDRHSCTAAQPNDEELDPLWRETKNLLGLPRIKASAVASARSQLENAGHLDAMASFLESKCCSPESRDVPGFWIPLIVQLQQGAHHKLSVEVFEWVRRHPTLLKPVDKASLSRLFSLMIAYPGRSRKLYVPEEPLPKEVLSEHHDSRLVLTKLARSWFMDMLARGVPRQTSNCNALLLVYARNLDIPSALALFERMESIFQLNSTSYNILISLYARANQLDKMEAALAKSRSAGVATSLFCFNTLLCSYANAQDGTKLLTTLQEMKTRGIAGDSTTFEALVSGFARLGMVEKMEQAVAESRRTGVALTEGLLHEVERARAGGKAGY